MAFAISASYHLLTSMTDSCWEYAVGIKMCCIVHRLYTTIHTEIHPENLHWHGGCSRMDCKTRGHVERSALLGYDYILVGLPESAECDRFLNMLPTSLHVFFCENAS